jgi:hypothetical protein
MQAIKEASQLRAMREVSGLNLADELPTVVDAWLTDANDGWIMATGSHR